MHTAMLRPVFMFVAWFQAISAHVEPPTNVTFHCHNFQNILEWSYGHLQPDLRFQVTVNSMNSDTVEQWVEPPTLQANLSNLPDPAYEYFVTITAVIGENTSDPSPDGGFEFSYFRNSLASLICSVDFPKVNVTSVEDGHVLFRFEHPWSLYKTNLPSYLDGSRKRRSDATKKSPPLEFTYDVTTIPQGTTQQFICEDIVCEGNIPVDPKEGKHCLKFTGELHKIEVKATQDYCAQAYKPSNLLFVVIPVVSILAIISFCAIMFMGYKKNTSPSSSSLPPSMTFAGRLKQFTFGVVQEPILVPSVCNAPHPKQQEEDGLISPDTSPTTEEDEGVSDIVDTENTEEPKYMAGSILETDETPTHSLAPSGYEKREKVFVELAPDEVAEAYRG